MYQGQHTTSPAPISLTQTSQKDSIAAGPGSDDTASPNNIPGRTSGMAGGYVTRSGRTCDTHTKAWLKRIRTQRNRTVKISALRSVAFFDQYCDVLQIEYVLSFFFVVRIKGREISYYVMPRAPIGPWEHEVNHFILTAMLFTRVSLLSYTTCCC